MSRDVYSCAHWLRPRNYPPRDSYYEGAIGQLRQTTSLCCFRYISPQFWLTYPLLRDELSPVSIFYCHSNPMITDEDSGIIKQVACGLPNGLQV